MLVNLSYSFNRSDIMATTDILLLQPVEGLGGEGEQVSVRLGYARNFLLPRKIAVPVNRANKKQIEALRQAREAREAKEREAAKTLAEKIEGASIAIAVKTGEGGKMFGSVTSQQLIDRLAEDGITLDKKMLNMPHPVKELGKHEVQVRLHSDLKVPLSFEVVSENPIEE